jgi:hypothetical protein
MRTVLVCVAVLGFPLAALAQPVKDNGRSTAIEDVTVVGHCAVPPETRWPNGMFDAPTDTTNKRTEESPGTRELILRDIAAVRNNTRDYKHMGSAIGTVARRQVGFTKRQVLCRGVFKGIKFLHVTESGDDDFEVDFSDGSIEWEVRPLTSKQQTEQFAFRSFRPQPVTDQFEGLMYSILRGQPYYDNLAPDFAARLRTQWPALQKSVKDWGALRSFYFLRRKDDGSYRYAASFQHGQVLWEVAPLDESNHMTGLTYDDGSN